MRCTVVSLCIIAWWHLHCGFLLQSSVVDNMPDDCNEWDPGSGIRTCRGRLYYCDSHCDIQLRTGHACLYYSGFSACLCNRWAMLEFILKNLRTCENGSGRSKYLKGPWILSCSHIENSILVPVSYCSRRSDGPRILDSLMMLIC